ncbi:MAG: metallophosphoesterase [Deltaproteobacteria bacterium]|nr:metallophosphoesterase [Deltaproteobacteria bacterium]
MFVIGDIHGCAKALEQLLAEIPTGETIFAVGDLIDRGPDSSKVVSICMESGIRSVMGNHEHMFLDYLDGAHFYGRGLFFANGGRETIESYGGNIPEDHIDYLRSLPLYIETDHFILSHAGVHFAYTLKDACNIKPNCDFNLLWNRSPLADLGKVQILGHTYNQNVLEIREKRKLIGINIDTGCCHDGYGKLTAISLPDLNTIHVRRPC